jgi:hypothetical protein
MKRGGPWDSTFEPIFNRPDGEISDFVAWLFTLEASRAGADSPILERITPQPLPDDRRQQIARITASLLARSPSIRHQIRLKAEYYRERFGLSDPKADKNLIAANQHSLYDAYRTYMEQGGRWGILFSDSREFVAGDGFLHNFPASPDGLGSGRKLVLPILPTATIIYMTPLGGYPAEPRLVTLHVAQAEVTRLNHIAQVYACDFLFFRSEQPALNAAFLVGEHRQFQYHQHVWLDGLLDDLSQYNLWGRGGTPGMCVRRPYSESIEGNRLLDSLSQPHS